MQIDYRETNSKYNAMSKPKYCTAITIGVRRRVQYGYAF